MSDFETVPVGTTAKLERALDALRMGLEIHHEYMRQIGRCVSQDYGRLNEFPRRCAEVGVTFSSERTS